MTIPRPLLIIAVSITTATLFSGCLLSKTIFWNVPGLRDAQRFASAPVAHDTLHPFEFHLPPAGLETLGSSIRVNADKYSLQTTTMDSFLLNSSTLAFMIIRHDTILYERYFKGYQADDNVTSFSVAKSFVGALVGIAISEGKIKSVEDPLSNYLDFLDPAIARSVQIKHLLNQTSGLRFKSDMNLYYTQDLKSQLARTRRAAAPGSRFKYENGNSQLLGLVLESAYHQPINQILSEKIWSRIGTEHDLDWSTDHSSTDIAKSFCCLNGRVRDFAKFGRLLLNMGKWNDRQIIPRSWLEDTYYNRSTKEGASIQYRNQMWSETGGWYMAVGLYGQYIVVLPKYDIVMLRFSRFNTATHPHWADFYRSVLAQLQPDERHH